MQATAVTLALAACATLPPPTAELAAAGQAVERATMADADQYAAAELASARDAHARAQAAMAAGREDEARKLALAAAAAADLAHARSRGARLEAERARHAVEIDDLQRRLGVDASGSAALDLPPPVEAGDASEGGLVLRLTALDADPRLQPLAAYERLRARQALDVLSAARSSGKSDALYLARRRVEIAEIAARNELLQREIDRLERERGALLVEASRQEAERARQEAERLRFQAQIAAEEAARLRAAAESEFQARQQAEGVLEDVAGEQAARLRAARERQAELARREAELLRQAEALEAGDDD
jgi:hypothetical protein